MCGLLSPRLGAGRTEPLSSPLGAGRTDFAFATPRKGCGPAGSREAPKLKERRRARGREALPSSGGRRPPPPCSAFQGSLVHGRGERAQLVHDNRPAPGVGLGQRRQRGAEAGGEGGEEAGVDAEGAAEGGIRGELLGWGVLVGEGGVRGCVAAVGRVARRVLGVGALRAWGGAWGLDARMQPEVPRSACAPSRTAVRPAGAPRARRSRGRERVSTGSRPGSRRVEETPNPTP